MARSPIESIRKVREKVRSESGSLYEKLGRNRSYPVVSVIVPVYNSELYIKECISSVLAQQMTIGAIEVIAVNDGSTDASGRILNELASADRRLLVIHQENSGGPSVPRNTGLAEAGGEYIFFLDADDVLAVDALERMVMVAENESSDVVLGRFGSLNGRNVPSHMFRRTVHDADIIETNAWDSLGPIKLYRRSLIEKLQLRFAPDQWIGEDQPFTASMYLNASKVSILSDSPYVYVRKRDDGLNITLRKQGLTDKLKTASRLGSVIARFTEPGERRDRLMRRIFTATLPSALADLILEATPEEIDSFVEAAQRELAPFYSIGVQAFCSPIHRVKYHLLMNGETSSLIEVAKHEQSNGPVTLSVFNGELVMDLPRAVANSVPSNLRVGITAPPIRHQLTTLSVSRGQFLIGGTAGFNGVTTAPSNITVVLVQRDTNFEISIPTEVLNVSRSGATVSREFLVRSSLLDQLKAAEEVDGAWGIFLEVVVGNVSARARFGSKPSWMADDKQLLVAESANGTKRPVIAYFNHGYKNLTFDVGCIIHPNALVADVVGLAFTGAPSAQKMCLYTRLVSDDDSKPTFTGSTGDILDSQQIGPHLYAAYHPIQAHGTTEVKVLVNIGTMRQVLALPRPGWSRFDGAVLDSADSALMLVDGAALAQLSD